MNSSNTITRSEGSWQSGFVRLLPEIELRLKCAFRHLDADKCEDAVAEAVAHSLLSYLRLHERGIASFVTASTIAHYSTLQVKRGRPAVGRMKGGEPLSRYAQISRGIRVTELHGEWIYEMIHDKRASVSDQVAAKIDISAWFETLSKRMRQIARDLAHGLTTSEAALKYGVTAGRISQIRRVLEDSWRTFQRDFTPATK